MEHKIRSLDEILELIDNEGAELAADTVAPAQTIDAAFELREIIRSAEREVNKKKERLEQLMVVLGLQFEAASTEDCPMTTMGGMRAVATVTEEQMPSVSDWDVFCAYIEENNCSYLLQKRLSNKAVMEMQAMSEIPGVKIAPVRRIGLRTR